MSMGIECYINSTGLPWYSFLFVLVAFLVAFFGLGLSVKMAIDFLRKRKNRVEEEETVK